MNSDAPAIGQRVTVRPHPTVVRLDDLDKPDSAWLTDSFVLTSDIRQHLQALRNLLRRDHGCGVFLIGHYGSGKSHFLAYLIRHLHERSRAGKAPRPVSISLVNYSADNRLETIVSSALGVDRKSGDRRPAWNAALGEGRPGVVLLLDELSEFLRSKPDLRAFTEDVRFLQFMGEWAQDHPFWVVAAMQEGIEHTGELEHSLYRKIKDRYPLRLLLTPTHVQSLIADSILIKKEDYEQAVERLTAELHRAYPGDEIDFGLLRSIYPLHPATLSLLEEVRDRFSQARGIVDFTVTRLRGDPARGVEPFLERPWGDLLTPDRIVDHFRDLFEIQPEFLALAQQVLPWYDKHLEALFTKPALKTLAERLLKLLILVHLSPARETLNPREAASWLLYSAIRTDPEKNVEIVQRVLATLAREGRYVTTSGHRYRLELKDDGRAEFQRQLAQAMQELHGQDALILEILTPLLPAESVNPFLLPRNQWQQRRLQWRFHERQYGVWFGEEPPSGPPEIALCIRPPWGTIEPAAGTCTVLPQPVVMTDEWLELAALLRMGEQPLAPEVTRHAARRIEQRTPWFQQAMRATWAEACLVSADGNREAAPPIESKTTLSEWLDGIALKLLRRRYPAFERFAPGHGPLPRQAWLRFMRYALEGDIGHYDADDYVKLIREAYLVPMGLMRRRGRDYTMPQRIEKQELVALLMPLLEHSPSPQTIERHLAEPIYGLVPDQTKALLLFLCLQGEIDIRKEDRSYRDSFESLPNPLQYDTVELAHALTAEQLQALQALCQGVGLRSPAQWTVLAQRRMVEKLAEQGRRHVERLHTLVTRLRADGLGEDLIRAITDQIELWRTLEKGDNPLQSFERFFYQAGSISGVLAQMQLFRELPERLPRLLEELRRAQHLLQHPALRETADKALGAAIAGLGSPPDPQRVDELEGWLHQARQIYSDYTTGYRAAHDAWWQAQAQHPIWQWQPPALARSRHIGVATLIAELEECRTQAAALRCRTLVNLDYQPLCTCGFRDGHAPIEPHLERFDTLRKRLEVALEQFFQQDSVKNTIREWRREGVELPDRTLSYLDGTVALPEITDVDRFDRQLAGLETVQEVDLSRITELLQKQVWNPQALSRAIAGELDSLQGGRLRFIGDAPSGPAPDDALIRWCAQQCLQHATPLPKALPAALRTRIGAALRPEWVGPHSIAALDRLGLDDAGLGRIVGWLIDGHVALPDREAEPGALVAAVSALLQPTDPTSAKALATTCETLYRHHGLMHRVAGLRWLDRLEAIARTPLPDLPPLTDLLQEHGQAQWLMLDCAGLPLLRCIRSTLEQTLPERSLRTEQFALVSSDTTTDGCYRTLLKEEINHFFEKIDVTDRLIHTRTVGFAELTALATTELKVALQSLHSRLDPTRPLLVFADHGFRLAADGRRYEHGGNSTLERVVPVIELGVAT